MRYITKCLTDAKLIQFVQNLHDVNWIQQPNQTRSATFGRDCADTKLNQNPLVIETS